MKYLIKVSEKNPGLTGGPQRYLPKRILALPHGLESGFIWAFVGDYKQCEAKLVKAKKHSRADRYWFEIAELNDEQAQQISAEESYKARQALTAGLSVTLSDDGTSICISAAAKKLNKAGQAFFDMFPGQKCGTFNDGRHYIKVRVK